MLSLVIPVYNEAPFLRRCLDSVVKQTRKANVIIVDDGSTDESGEICEEYRCMGFEVYHTKNLGVSHARNYGINRAKTRWVTFLDADDELCPDAFENMLSQANSKEKIVGFNQLRHYDNAPAPKLKYYNKPGFYGILNFPKQMCMVWNKMYRVDFLNENNIRFWEDVGYGEDEIFNLECLLKAKTIKCCRPATIIRYFDNKQSIVHLITGEDLDRQQEALGRLLEQQTGLNKRIVAKVLEEHKHSGWDKVVRNDPNKQNK